MGKEGVANPNPDEAMAFDDRINPDRCILVDTLLPRHPHALAAFVKFQSMVTAHQMVAFQISSGKREEAVGTTIFEGRELARDLAIKNDWFPADSACQRSTLNFVIPGCGVPVISEEQERLLSLFQFVERYFILTPAKL